jgi:alkaline phosphatase
MGPGSNLVQGVIEQNVIFHIINQAQQLGGTKY